MVLGFQKTPAILQNVSCLSCIPSCQPWRISGPGALAAFSSRVCSRWTLGFR